MSRDLNGPRICDFDKIKPLCSIRIAKTHLELCITDQDKDRKGTKLVHDLAIVSPLCGDERTALLCICLAEMLLKCDVATTDMRCNCKCMT